MTHAHDAERQEALALEERALLDSAEKYRARAEEAERQVAEVRRVITALHNASGSIHGRVIDEVRKSTGDWLEAALDGTLDPVDVKRGYYAKKKRGGNCPKCGEPLLSQARDRTKVWCSGESCTYEAMVAR